MVVRPGRDISLVIVPSRQPEVRDLVCILIDYYDNVGMTCVAYILDHPGIAHILPVKI